MYMDLKGSVLVERGVFHQRLGLDVHLQQTEQQHRQRRHRRVIERQEKAFKYRLFLATPLDHCNAARHLSIVKANQRDWSIVGSSVTALLW